MARFLQVRQASDLVRSRMRMALNVKPRRMLPLAATFGVTLFAPAARPAEPRDEVPSKTGALVNVVSFTEWPASAFSSPTAPLVIGVLGRESEHADLDVSMAAETWHGRRIEFRRVNSADAVRSCHVLYVDRAESRRWQRIRTQVARLPILTLSDQPRFIHDGGMVELAASPGRVRLRIHLGATRAAGLILSSKVLRIAEVVDEAGP